MFDTLLARTTARMLIRVYRSASPLELVAIRYVSSSFEIADISFCVLSCVVFQKMLCNSTR